MNLASVLQPLDSQRSWELAFDPSSAADTVTKAVVALLAMVGVVLVGIGLARAWKGRLLPQVVIEDLPPVAGQSTAAIAALTRELRQAVQDALLRESRDASYAVLKTIQDDIAAKLLNVHGHVHLDAIASGMTSTTQDSLTTLAAGVRAVAPKEADGLMAALGAALPRQRGWTARVFPEVRIRGGNPLTGLAVEFAELGRPADAITAFEVDLPEKIGVADASAVEESAVYEGIQQLLAPTSLWIAGRLVSRQLAQSGIPVRWRLLPGRRLKYQLRGLQLQLAGQMSLYGTRKERRFDRGFAKQALNDLREAGRLLPTYFRCSYTAAAALERLARSYERDGDSTAAGEQYALSVREYDEAERILLGSKHVPENVVRLTVERLRVRRATCRLLSMDPGYLRSAAQDVEDLSHMTATEGRDLYNAACLFAIVAACPELQGEVRARGKRLTWYYLGRALMESGEAGLWDYVLTDVDLQALEGDRLQDLRARLLARNSTRSGLPPDASVVIVTEVLQQMGLAVKT